MPLGAVLVPPAAVARQQRVDGAEQVAVRAGPGFDDRQTGRGVRHEDVEQPVLLAGKELLALAGEVVYPRLCSGSDLDRLGTHGLILPRRGKPGADVTVA